MFQFESGCVVLPFPLNFIGMSENKDFDFPKLKNLNIGNLNCSVRRLNFFKVKFVNSSIKIVKIETIEF